MVEKREGITVNEPSKTFDGYTLFAPLGQTDAYLIDMGGDLVKHWDLPSRPGAEVQLLPNGNLLCACRSDPEKKEDEGAPKWSGHGGLMQEIDWDNNVVWEYEDVFQHHDFYRMENGNTMYMRYEEVPREMAEKVKGGVSMREYKLWTDGFHEVTPEGEVVWEWKAYEHLDPEDHSICPLCPRHEWTHGNNVHVLPSGDILTSFRQIDLACRISKETGEIDWSWGRGTGELAHPHDPHLLENGNYLIFDNGFHRKGVEVNTSMVLELDPETKEIEWEYRGDPSTSFYSAVCSSAERLPNGNTMICETTGGRVFEVDEEGDIVWEYINPHYGEIKFGSVNWLFRAHRYAPDFEGFKDRDLSPE